MRDGAGDSPRVALLLNGDAAADATAERYVGDVSAALQRSGATAHVLRPDGRMLHVFDAVLYRRGFAGPLSAVPLGIGALMRGHYDLAHAFSAVDAMAAIGWRRVTGRPVVFTCLETLDRGTIAHRRLRLAMLRRAVEEADAVAAPTEATREALARWLLADAPVLAAGDASAHGRLYRAVLERRT